MSLVFYTAPMSSASPVACALAELGLPHERVTFDLSAQKHKSPEFLKLNPNGKVPTLVVDGTPMFEGLAIMQYLGDRYGVERGLWPASDSPERCTALSWSTWAYVSYGAGLYRLLFATHPRLDAAMHHAGQAELARQDLQAMLDVLEQHLSEREFILGTNYSLCDLIVACTLGYGVFVGQPVDKHPRVAAWLARFQAREAFTQ